MTGCYLDTTVVVTACDPDLPDASKTKIEAEIRSLQPAALAHYALRELLAGYIRPLCEAHNELLAAETPAEALLAFLKRVPQEGRKRETRIKAFAQELNAAFENSPTGDRSHLKREILESLSMRIHRLWRAAQRIKSVDLTQPLGCFPGGNIAVGSSGDLRGPSDTFNCAQKSRCSAAEYLYEDRAALKKLIEALHPERLPPEVATKSENAKRRAALKELESRGPRDFNKAKCRHLGDAYFAAMCPPGAVVLTTNIVDFLPLCNALSKQARRL